MKPASILSAIALIGVLLAPVDGNIAQPRAVQIAGLAVGDAEPGDQPLSRGRSVMIPMPHRVTSGRSKRLRCKPRKKTSCDDAKTPTCVTQDVHDQAINAYERRIIQIGQDIHDGPIQLLSIFVMRLSEISGSEQPLSSHQRANVEAFSNNLLTRALADLRDICVGIVLPGLEGLNAEETIRLAVREHERSTNSSVLYEIAPFASQPSS